MVDINRHRTSWFGFGWRFMYAKNDFFALVIRLAWWQWWFTWDSDNESQPLNEEP
jgi:hypothetical protein